MEKKDNPANKTAEKIIDKAIRHCQNLRPEETGHGVTIAFLKEIKEQTKHLQEEIENRNNYYEDKIDMLVRIAKEEQYYSKSIKENLQEELRLTKQSCEAYAKKFQQYHDANSDNANKVLKLQEENALLKQENDTLDFDLSQYKDKYALLKKAAEGLAQSLESAINGLLWFKDTYPDSQSQADEDFLNEADNAISDYNKLINGEG